MTTNRVTPLYTPEVLALAVELAAYPPLSDPASHAELRSRTCGSVARIGLATDGEGAIETIGLKMSACAIGQAAAAIFAGDAQGKKAEDLDSAVAAVEVWLAEGGPRPEWPRLELLDAAVAHPGRHEAILLPWRAAAAALSKDNGAR
ncbi:iron-sulfur cluster assembly scaffold protein [Qipengyuania spongiae]|uniref:Iron-sulfur cluster assembly scaffold protein n=1 Tax=Qipengyuania spongiae TaxID=2909673 RepID=A0ABY5SXC2_9SPHN|nr:iron-sulfur cluster assembly scaffold protein [Qipengyuania spongiae]UVI38864.1 iron-sulfur cluster assembly scaffold protein [Qipengyuania spongiae]